MERMNIQVWCQREKSDGVAFNRRDHQERERGLEDQPWDTLCPRRNRGTGGEDQGSRRLGGLERVRSPERGSPRSQAPSKLVGTGKPPALADEVDCMDLATAPGDKLRWGPVSHSEGRSEV